MTVETTTTKVFATLNGVATAFSFAPLVIFVSSDLVVTLVDLAGNETALSEGAGSANYSVSVSTYPGTGSITYPATGSAANNGKLVMKRVLVIQQTTNLENQGGYFPDTQETALDRLTMVDLQQQEEIDRSLRFPVSDVSAARELPTAVQRAGLALIFDSLGTPTAGAIPSTIVSAAMIPVVQAATLAAALTTLGAAPKDARAVLASATTTNIGASTASYIQITLGASPIAAFDTVVAGTERTLEFAGVITLTNSAALILPGARDITTAAGDCADFRSEGSGNWRCTSYTQAVTPPGGGRSILAFVGATSQTSGTTEFYGPAFFSPTEANVTVKMPFAATIRNLYMTLSAAPGGSDTFVATVRKNGVDTAVTCTATGAAISANDATHSVAFAAGDLVCVKVISSATAASSGIRLTMEVDG